MGVAYSATMYVWKITAALLCKQTLFRYMSMRSKELSETITIHFPKCNQTTESSEHSKPKIFPDAVYCNIQNIFYGFTKWTK